MTISNRAKVLIVGLLIIIAILLIIFFLPKREPAALVEPVAEEEALEVFIEEKDGAAVEPMTEERQEELSAATLAGVFTERFGSYSSESDFANLYDVISLATSSYRQEILNLIARLKASSSGQYYGVTTRVISKTVIAEEAGVTVFEVLTQREESIGDASSSSIRYQTLRLKLRQEDDLWKVDGAEWLD